MIYREVQSGDPGTAKPSTAFLVVLNGLLCFGTLAIGSNMLGVIFAIPATLLFMAISGILQLLFRRSIERKRILKPFPRILIYTSPWWILALLPFLGIHPPQSPNKKNPATSPSGNYIARIKAPPEGWTIRIKNVNSGKPWTETTDFVPHLNIYWHWDAEDRFWIYNSDDGVVHCMRIQPNTNNWIMEEWGSGRTKREGISELMEPPEDLYPPYAR